MLITRPRYARVHFHPRGNTRRLNGATQIVHDMIDDSLNVNVNNVYRGLSGAAFNTEIELTNKIPYLSNFGIDSYHKVIPSPDPEIASGTALRGG